MHTYLSPKGNVPKHSRGVQLFSLDLINSVWITKTEVSKAQAGTGLFFSEKNLYCSGGRMDGDKKGSLNIFKL